MAKAISSIRVFTVRRLDGLLANYHIDELACTASHFTTKTPKKGKLFIYCSGLYLRLAQHVYDEEDDPANVTCISEGLDEPYPRPEPAHFGHDDWERQYLHIDFHLPT